MNNNNLQLVIPLINGSVDLGYFYINETFGKLRIVSKV